MGFRDLYAYNLALLTKQGWRFVHNPDSLAGMLFKAKYFPTTSLWDVVSGPSASHCWRSIINARSMLVGGSKWLVGNGGSISDLIDVVNRPWNSDSLTLLFSHEDQLVIKSISLSLKFPANRLIWHYNAKGSFTVKSAYHVAYSSLQDHCLTASTYVGGSNGYSHLWSTLWRANVPNEVKICVWRATLNILAARSNLVRRGATSWLQEFRRVHSIPHTDCPLLPVRWLAPLEGWFKINVDGALNITLGLGCGCGGP
ncbi:unnamed protein product [Prunus armeniaca]